MRGCRRSRPGWRNCTLGGAPARATSANSCAQVTKLKAVFPQAASASARRARSIAPRIRPWGCIAEDVTRVLSLRDPGVMLTSMRAFPALMLCALALLTAAWTSAGNPTPPLCTFSDHLRHKTLSVWKAGKPRLPLYHRFCGPAEAIVYGAEPRSVSMVARAATPMASRESKSGCCHTRRWHRVEPSCSAFALPQPAPARSSWKTDRMGDT